jgi:hypothetical protein
MFVPPFALLRRLALLAGWGFGAALLAGAEPTAEDIRALLEQNRRLQEQVTAQQKTIDELNARMREVAGASERHERELRELRDHAAEGPAAPAASLGRDQQVRIAAEAGLAFFRTGSEGQFPKSEFRADDPVISVEAPVMKDVYFFAELKLLTRETNLDSFQLGELYADFEDVSAAWNRPGLLNVRVGRLNLPFGEEYQVRTPVANPLISHSLSDVWGVDEGVEAYGKFGPVRYAVAVQNGGTSRLRDFNADKSVAARLSWQPAAWLAVSGSAMRTGELSTAGDVLSEVWLANGFFRSIAPGNRAGTFWANLFEADAKARWHGGHLALALGQARYDDNDPAGDNSRRIDYGYAEAVQTLTGPFYAAARYSALRAPRGYPLVGWGSMGTYFFRPSLTEELHRLSVGLGWRIGAPVIWKIEYAWERGRLVTGVRRTAEDFLGSELAVRF